MSVEEALTKPPQSRFALYSGKTLQEWADSTGISLNTLRKRIKAGLSIEEAISTPYQQRAKVRDAVHDLIASKD